jgi:hypothetical protein
VLDRLISHIRQVRPALYRTCDFSSCTTTPQHIQQQKFEFLTKKLVTTLNHTPYSPDFSLLNHFLFSKVKLQLKGARFDTIQEIQKAMTDRLNKIPAEDFCNAMKKLETRANMCITSNESYFE